MRRVKDDSGVAHFAGRDARRTLCGLHRDTDLLGSVAPLDETNEPVACPNCAELYCRIKNAPWNEVDEAVLHAACYEATKP